MKDRVYIDESGYWSSYEELLHLLTDCTEFIEMLENKGGARGRQLACWLKETKKRLRKE